MAKRKSSPRWLGLVSAAVLLAGVVGVALPARAGGDLVTNGSFASVEATGVPTGWSTWKPAGNASLAVEPTSGPRGNPAAHITAASTADRLALVQRVPVSSETPRTLQLSGWMRAQGLSGGWTSLRVQVRDAAGATVVPVVYVGRDTGTYDWRRVTHTVQLPDGAATVFVEPMLDRSGGEVWFSDISLAPVSAVGNVRTSVRETGEVELSWDFSGVSADHFDLYRAEGDQAPLLDDAHLVRRAWADTTADDSVQAGRFYTYVVVARDSTGAFLIASDPVSVLTPASPANLQRNTTMTALRTAEGVAVSWKLAATEASGDLEIVASHGPITAGGRKPAGARIVTVVPASAERATLPLDTPPHLALVSQGGVLATTRSGGLTHPRAGLTPAALRRVREAITAEPTAIGAWSATKARVDGPITAYPSGTGGQLYKAREAAFVYAVTNDPAYAQKAYDAMLGGAGHVQARPVNMGLELARANLLLASTYDWAYNGWTEQQRDTARHLMLKSVDLLSTYHHDALDDAEKTSNWVGVVRTTELAMLLLARGDGDFGLHDRRIAFLTDQVAQHLDQGYNDSGYTQEGWDYLHYTALYMFPSVYAAQDTGLETLTPHFNRPQWWNLALHAVSARPGGDVLQWGVGTPRGQTAGILPLLMPITPRTALPGLRWIYDRTIGVDSPNPTYDGTASVWNLLYYSSTGTSNPEAISHPEAHTALRDDTSGFYAFRSGYTGVNDVQVAVSNRNTQHRGWAGSETFGLSLLGEGATWATMGGKEADPLLFSKPLVDGKIEARGQYTTERGEGRTIASHSYDGQGGGYVHLDGSRNFEVDTADRQMVVDLSPGVGTSALIAIADRFADASAHTWDWQLRPDSSVQMSVNGPNQTGEPTFTFSKDGKVLNGWVLGDGYDIGTVDGTLRITKVGTSADFRIVLALGSTAGQLLTTGADGAVRVAGRTLDLNRLAEYSPVRQ